MDRLSASLDGTRPAYVVWELTLRCDLACGHCGSRAGRPRERELSVAEALEVAAQIADLGAREVTLMGGEAYLHEGWTDIVRALRGAGLAVTMTTAGRGMTPERARLAADAGVQSVSVSIDGLQPAHDTLRRVQGAFDSGVRALDNLREAGVPVCVNTQINRLSLPDLDGLFDTVIAPRCHAWQVQLTFPMGGAADHPEWLLQPYDLLTVMPKLADLTERGRARGVRLWPGNNVGYFGPLEGLIRGSIRPGAYHSGCRAGRDILGIESDGGIKGCLSMTSGAYVGGNVRETSLRALYDGSPRVRYARERGTSDLWGFCADCYYAEECRAGCIGTSHVLFGRPGNNPYCHHRALELQKKGLRERLVPLSFAPGRPFDHGVFDLVLEPFDSAEPPLSPNPAGSPLRCLPVV